MSVARLIAILGLCLYAQGTLANEAEDPHATLVKLVVDGEDLYKRAEKMIKMRPGTSSQADEIANGIGKQWHADEHDFQADVWRIRKDINLPDDVSQGMLRLHQFDSFVFHAVTEMLDCRNILAASTLEIAQKMLQRARMAAEGHPEPDWDPDFDAPEDRGMCR
jgi:hypothetical protein